MEDIQSGVDYTRLDIASGCGLFLEGVQLISGGVLDQSVGRIHCEAKKRPLYVVAEKIGLE